MRLVRDGDSETGRLKGFGYADFEDRNSLLEALGMAEYTLKNRKIRIDLASQSGNRGGFGGGGFGERRGRYDNNRGGDGGDDDRTMGNWRSAPRAASPPREDRNNGYGGGGGGRDRYEPPRDRYGGDRDRGEHSFRNFERGRFSE